MSGCKRDFFNIDGETLTFQQAVDKIFGHPVVHSKYEGCPEYYVPNENDELRSMISFLNASFQSFMEKHGSPGYAQDMYNYAFSIMELLADTQPIRATWSNNKRVTNLDLDSLKYDLDKLTTKLTDYSNLMSKKNTKKSRRVLSELNDCLNKCTEWVEEMIQEEGEDE